MATQLGEYRDPGVCQQVTELTADTDGQWLRATIPGQLDELMNDAAFFAYIISANGAILERTLDGIRISNAALGVGLTGGGPDLVTLSMAALGAVPSPDAADRIWIERAGVQQRINYSDFIGQAGGTDITTVLTNTEATINSSTGTGDTIPLVTQTVAGLLGPLDKIKLDGIPATANDYSHPNHTGDVTSFGDGATSIANGVVSLGKLAADAITQLSHSVTTTTITVINSTGSNAVLPAATATTAGVLTAADKQKLDASVAYVHPNHTGEVTSSGDGATFITLGAVSFDKLAPNAITNLAYNASATAGTITNSVGTNATIPAATTTTAGVMTAVDRTRMDSVVWVTDFGADPTGATDSSSAFQDALNTGQNVFVPDGNYRLNSTVTFSTGGQAMFGTGAFKCMLTSYITNGSPTVDTGGFDLSEVRDLSIWGNTQTVPYQDTTALSITNSTRSYLSNVNIRYCNEGLQAVDSWVLTGINIWVRNCNKGCTFAQLNASSLILDTNSNEQPFSMDNCNGTTIEYSGEGTPPTVSATMDDCEGINFSKFYNEHNVAGTVPEIVIGGTSRCVGVRFDAINVARPSDGIATWALDQVEGFYLGTGRFLGGTSGLAWTFTSNTGTITSHLAGATGAQGEYLPPPIISLLHQENLIEDPYLELGIPTFDSATRASVAEDTTTVPDGLSRSIAITATAATFNYATLSYDLTQHPYNTLLGQKAGVGAFVHAPDTLNFQGNVPRCQIWASVDGTGGGIAPTRNTDYLPGQWVTAWNDLDIPADATTLTVRLYANNSGDNITGDTVHFCGLSLWNGGGRCAEKFYAGRLQATAARGIMAGPNTVVLNAGLVDAAAKGVNISGLPVTATGGTVLLAEDASGNLAHLPASSIVATSRKSGIDDLGTIAVSSLAVDWDTGNFDNKQVELGADVLTVTFTATRSGRYVLHVKQDGTGYRKLYLTSVNTSPQLDYVPLVFTAGRITTIEFDFNDSTGIWSW